MNSPVDICRARARGMRALGALSAGLVSAGLALLAGCSLIAPRPAPVAVTPASPPPAPALPLPLDTHHFVLAGTDDDVVGAVQVTEARKQDTLLDIARRFNVGYNEIVNANPGVDIWIPGAGRKVIVPTQFVLPPAPREGLVIDVAALRLFYYPPRKAGEPITVYTYPIGIGKAGWHTPEGVTHVTLKVPHPTWHPSLALREDHYRDNGERLPAVVPPGPDNPLGAFEFRLGWPGYLIHGTDKPYGVGLRSSHGCVRLYPEDIARLFEMVPVGTRVQVVNQPFLFGWRDHQLYLQAYPVLEDDHRDWRRGQQRLLTQLLSARLRQDLHSEGMQIDWQSVAALTTAPRAIPVPVAGSGAHGGLDAVLSGAPEVQNRIPAGADWDGSDDASAQDKSPGQVLSDLEPASASAADQATAAAASRAPAAAQNAAHSAAPSGT